MTRYEVQKSLAGGAFVDVAQGPAPAVLDPSTGTVTTPAATSITESVATGTATRYRVRACNDGTCTAYTTMNPFTLATFQENNASVSFRAPGTAQSWPAPSAARSAPPRWPGTARR